MKKEKSNERKMKFLAGVEREFGRGLVEFADDASGRVERLATGIAQVDWLTLGGLPLGKVTLLRGAEGGTKTTMAIIACARYLERFPDRLAVYIDAEEKYPEQFVKRLGIDGSRFVKAAPETAEETIDFLDYTLRQRSVGILVLDSIASLLPKIEREEPMEKQQQGMAARLVNKMCVDGDALVFLDSGIPKQLRDLKAGNHIRSIKDGKTIWQTVENVWYGGKKATLEINGQLKVTYDHEVFTRQGFIRADQLRKGDCLARTRKSLHCWQSAMGPHRARLLGYLIGDGSWRPHGGPMLCAFDADVYRELSTIMMDEFQCKLNDKKGGWRICKGPTFPSGSHKNPVRTWLKELGIDFSTKARTKTLPSIVFDLPLSEIAQVIAGLWMSDGWIANQKPDGGHTGLTTTSKTLALQVRDLLLRFSIWSNLHYVAATDSYRLTVGSSNLIVFRDVIPLTGYKRAAIMLITAVGKECCEQDWMPDDLIPQIRTVVSGVEAAQLVGTLRQSYPEWNKPRRVKLSRQAIRKIGLATEQPLLIAEADSDIWWERVKTIRQIPKSEVYDITMIGKPNFEVENYFVHNCRKAVGALRARHVAYKWSPTVILVNQERIKIGQFYGDPSTIPGGEGQKFASSLILKMRALTVKDDDRKDWGLPEEHPVVKVATTVVKHSFGPRGKGAEYLMAMAAVGNLKAGEAFDHEFVRALAVRRNLVGQNGKAEREIAERGELYHKLKTQILEGICR